MAIKTTVGIKNRFYKNDISCVNNTTLNFGEAQPLYMRLLLKKGHSVQLSLKQFLRLAPMPYPTLADIRLKNVVKFVPMEDVDPLFSARLSQQSVLLSSGSTVTPNKQLSITLSNLWKLLVNLLDTEVALFDKATTTLELNNNQFSSLVTSINGDFGLSLMPSNYTTLYSNLNAFDYVYEFKGADWQDHYVGFRLGKSGRNLIKVLRGLGYCPEYDNNQEVNFVPLMAYYKAVFDEFNPQRTIQFQNTNCYRLIQTMAADPINTQIVTSVTTGLVHSFITDLANQYTTEGLNFHSLHTQAAVNPSSEIAPSDPTFSASTIKIGGSSLPFMSNETATSLFNKPLLDLLRHYTHIVNKDSIIGKNLRKWMEVRFGSEVMYSLFNESLNVGRNELAVTIDDIFSTSDTAQESNGVRTGELLGAFAGKGVASSVKNPLKVSFKAPSAGYLFVISYVQPICNFYNGTNPQLLLRNYDTYPQLEYDAVGFEVTPKACMYDNNDIQDNTSSPNDLTASFGFVPRYTGYKLSNRRDIVNGDFRRRSSAQAYQTYFLNKQITSSILTSVPKQSSSIFYNVLPTASEEWRYVSRYPWLSNYNRMFYNSGDTKDYYVDDNTFFPIFGSDKALDDNFILHSVIDAVENSPLKPIGMSYDTICENDNSTTQVLNA